MNGADPAVPPLTRSDDPVPSRLWDLGLDDADAPPSPVRWPVASDRPVLVVGPNPAMDRIQLLPVLRPGEVHRVRSVLSAAGGKSVIVARSLRTLGTPVALYGLLGGPVGAMVAAECRELGIEDRHTAIAGDTRITPVIVEEQSGRSTVLNEPGPQVSAREAERMSEAALDDARRGDLLVCTGSLPPGISTRFYADLAAAAQAGGALVAVDASGPALAHALLAAPWLVKCNQAEFSVATGATPDTAGLAAAVRKQVAAGSTVVIVTRGSADLLVGTAQGLWWVQVPPTRTVNATGSGDTFLGCFAAAVVSGGSLADAVRLGAAGGAANAAQLVAGLRSTAGLAELLHEVRFSPGPPDSEAAA